MTDQPEETLPVAKTNATYVLPMSGVDLIDGVWVAWDMGGEDYTARIVATWPDDGGVPLITELLSGEDDD